MSGIRFRRALLGAVVTLALAGSAAQAGRVRDVALGLGAAGFNIEGDFNYLNGGLDLLVNRNFIGNPLDFGTWDLAMAGPLSFDVSAGRRLVPGVDIALSTALNADSTVRPLSYAYNADLGIQSQRVEGNMLLDARASFNALGYYNLALEYAADQSVTLEGQLTNATGEGAFAVPRMELSGNVVADLLAAATQPIFDANGSANPFLAFSGESSLAAIALDPDQAALRRLASGDTGVGFEAVAILPTGLSFDGVAARLAPFDSVALPASVPTSGIVPEPASLVLLLVGVPAVMGRRMRRRW